MRIRPKTAPLQDKGAALTSKPDRSLFGKLAQWYHPSAGAVSREGNVPRKGGPPALYNP